MRILETLLAFVFGMLFAFFLLCAMTEPLTPPNKHVVRIEV